MYVPNLFSMLSGTYPNVGSRCSGFLAGESLYLRRNQSERKEAREIQRSEKIKVATAARGIAQGGTPTRKTGLIGQLNERSSRRKKKSLS